MGLTAMVGLTFFLFSNKVDKKIKIYYNYTIKNNYRQGENIVKNKGLLIFSIILFIVVAVFALILILNKGYLGNTSIISLSYGEKIEASTEKEQNKPELTVEIEKDYIAKTKKEKSKVLVSIDGEEVTDGYEIESSNEDIAKINDDNEVVAVANGKATITVRYDGMEASDDIQVITPVSSMVFTSTSSVVRVGKQLQMKLTMTPSLASTEPLEYTSSDEEIATVNQNGIVTGVSAGSVKITVHDRYTDMEKSVNLTIKK